MLEERCAIPTPILHARCSFPNVSTIQVTAPTSSFNGVQCNANLSNPICGLAQSFKSRLMACPIFSELLTADLKSQLKDPEL